MFLSFFFACACCWSFNDFRNEVDVQVYKISQQVEDAGSEDLYNLGYLNGKLDVYKSFQYNMDNEPKPPDD